MGYPDWWFVVWMVLREMRTPPHIVKAFCQYYQSRDKFPNIDGPHSWKQKVMDGMKLETLIEDIKCRADNYGYTHMDTICLDDATEMAHNYLKSLELERDEG